MYLEAYNLLLQTYYFYCGLVDYMGKSPLNWKIKSTFLYLDFVTTQNKILTSVIYINKKGTVYQR
jgi:hypothetical protein